MRKKKQGVCVEAGGAGGGGGSGAGANKENDTNDDADSLLHNTTMFVPDFKILGEVVAERSVTEHFIWEQQKLTK